MEKSIVVYGNEGLYFKYKYIFVCNMCVFIPNVYDIVNTL